MSGSGEPCRVKNLCPPPQLIEPDECQNVDSNHNLAFELNRDILKLRVEDYDSNPPSSCGEDDDDNPEHSFDAVIAADPSWIEPSQDVVISMVSLLDHYFSDENLVKDKFLLKHVRRNKQGYVSVKLLTSFKKLKHLSRSDWRVTAFCCKSSQNLELNHSGNKVKRREQEKLPHIDLPTTSIKTILAKLPTGDMMTVDEISFIFRKFGSLSTVRLIRPGKEVPLDLRNHVAKHPELGQSTCAVVEFDKTEECSGRNPRRQQKKQKAKERQGLLGGSYGYDSSEEFGSSPFPSSRENSPEIRRKFPLNTRSGQYLTPSPLVSPYGSRSNSPMRHSSSGHPSPNFQRRSATESPVPNNKWAIGSRSKLGQSPLARRRQITSPNDHFSKATPPSPLVVPNLLGKVSRSAQSGVYGLQGTPLSTSYEKLNPVKSKVDDIFNKSIEVWSNETYSDSHHVKSDLSQSQSPLSRSLTDTSHGFESPRDAGRLIDHTRANQRFESLQAPSFHERGFFNNHTQTQSYCNHMTRSQSNSNILGRVSDLPHSQYQHNPNPLSSHRNSNSTIARQVNNHSHNQSFSSQADFLQNDYSPFHRIRKESEGDHMNDHQVRSGSNLHFQNHQNNLFDFTSHLTKSFSNPNIFSLYANPTTPSSISEKPIDILNPPRRHSPSPPPLFPADTPSPPNNPLPPLETLQSSNSLGEMLDPFQHPSSYSAGAQSGFTFNNNNEESAAKSPWFRRRQDFLAAQNDSPLGSPSGSPILSRKNIGVRQSKANPADWFSSSEGTGVLRMPRGPPDNSTKGFHRDNPVLGKLEMLSSQVAAAATYESSSQPNC